MNRIHGLYLQRRARKSERFEHVIYNHVNCETIDKFQTIYRTVLSRAHSVAHENAETEESVRRNCATKSGNASESRMSSKLTEKV